MADETITPQEIRRAFPAKIAPVKVTWYYRAWLSAVLIALLLLQFLYIALLGIVAAATVYYMTIIPEIVSTVRLNFITIVLIGAPLISGVIVAFFLFKPIFARRRPAPEPPALRREDQPELYAFVEALCESLGAPAPSVISVSLDVNASAGLRRGMRSLMRNDLRLMIGLPLVSGLSLRQLTGVMAHEFGHFSQTAGIRSWFLIQTIQHWFARVVYDRDSWDVWLDEWREGADSWQIRALLWVADASVRASRWVLRLLMKAGEIVSCAFSRQMEYDADHYEAQTVGADTFEETSFAIAGLSATASQSWRQLDQGWRMRKLADDFPSVVQSYWNESTTGWHDAIRSAVLDERTETYATHPATIDRIANVRQADAAGNFELDGPAHRLFRDYDGLCRKITAEHYGESLGEDLETAQVLQAAEWKALMDEASGHAVARLEILGKVNFAERWLDLAKAPVASSAERDDDVRYAQLVNRLVNQSTGVAVLEAGLQIGSGTFQLTNTDTAGAQRELETTYRDLTEEEIVLRGAFAEGEDRLRAVDAPERSALIALRAIQPLLQELRVANACRQIFEINGRSEGLARLDAALDAVAAADPSLAAIRNADAVLQRADAVGEKLLGELCILARGDSR